MRRLFLILFVLLAGASLAAGQDSSALRRQRAPGQIPCPKVIASKASGFYLRRTSNPQRFPFPFECYRSSQSATRAGFRRQTLRITDETPTGWWRAEVSLKKDSCSGPPAPGVTNLFMQVKENDSGVFGAICPGALDFTGEKRPYGALVIARETLNEDPSASICDDGKVEISYVFELDGIYADKASLARYKILKRCLSEASGTVSCSQEWEGKASREKGHPWPDVPENVNILRSTCDLTLSKCSVCH